MNGSSFCNVAFFPEQQTTRKMHKLRPQTTKWYPGPREGDGRMSLAVRGAAGYRRDWWTGTSNTLLLSNTGQKTLSRISRSIQRASALHKCCQDGSSNSSFTTKSCACATISSRGVWAVILHLIYCCLSPSELTGKFYSSWQSNPSISALIRPRH
jgi:hypothetical protein